MQYLKKHEKLRAFLIALLFLLGLVLTYVGWKITGKLTGLGIMIVGIIFLLTALFVYNGAYKH